MPGFLAVIPSLVDLFGKIFGLDMTSDDNKIKLAEFQLKAQQLVSEELKGQMEVNKVEASSTDPFVSRWRPFIGWVCGVAFSYHFVLQPLLVFLFIAAGKKIELPIFDMSTLMPVLLGMLGLGAMRSYDKVKGTSQ